MNSTRLFVPLRESKDSMAAVMGEKDRLISRSKYSMDVRCNNTRAHGGTVQTRPSTSRHGRRVPHGKELPDVICITQVRFHFNTGVSTTRSHLHAWALHPVVAVVVFALAMCVRAGKHCSS